MTALRVCSWNVNGIRAARRKGAEAWLKQQQANLLGLQEVRASVADAELGILAEVCGYAWHDIRCAARKGYSGVGLLTREPPEETQTTLHPDFDAEGRFHLVRFGQLALANIYFPNGNGKDRDNSRVPYKLAFYAEVERQLWARSQAGQRVVVMGDFNTAHTPIDLARPKANEKTSGFLPEERAELSRWIDKGWCDTFRVYEAEGGHYSWWSQRAGARQRNVGWRIDYVLCCPNARPFLKAAGISAEILGSDHCPIWADFDTEITRSAELNA